MPRGRVVGQRGSISRLGAQPALQAAVPAVGQAAAAAHRGAATAQGAPVAAGGVRGVAPTRPSAPGTQHVKPLQNLPGELNKTTTKTTNKQTKNQLQLQQIQNPINCEKKKQKIPKKKYQKDQYTNILKQQQRHAATNTTPTRTARKKAQQYIKQSKKFT